MENTAKYKITMPRGSFFSLKNSVAILLPRDHFRTVDFLSLIRYVSAKVLFSDFTEDFFELKFKGLRFKRFNLSI